ncbi:hypothetical protein Scep_008279 [Stephania cephalantha]|uniref:Uncharacterized protein n=1 Tax=Stephania cephalantha TaxID=152367 RepID=A0AAP0KE18_9MAGN
MVFTTITYPSDVTVLMKGLHGDALDPPWLPPSSLKPAIIVADFAFDFDGIDLLFFFLVQTTMNLGKTTCCGQHGVRGYQMMRGTTTLREFGNTFYVCDFSSNFHVLCLLPLDYPRLAYFLFHLERVGHFCYMSFAIPTLFHEAFGHVMVVVAYFYVMILVVGTWSWCSQRDPLAQFHKLDLTYSVLCNDNPLVIAPYRKLVCIYVAAHGNEIVLCSMMPKQLMVVQLSTHYLLICFQDELCAMALYFFLDWTSALKLNSIPLAFMIDCVLHSHFISPMPTSQACGFPHIVGVLQSMFVQYAYLLVAYEVVFVISLNNWGLWSTLLAGCSVYLSFFLRVNHLSTFASRQARATVVYVVPEGSSAYIDVVFQVFDDMLLRVFGCLTTLVVLTTMKFWIELARCLALMGTMQFEATFGNTGWLMHLALSCTIASMGASLAFGPLLLLTCKIMRWIWILAWSPAFVFPYIFLFCFMTGITNFV